ncbi:PDR/VanB family oxidoreductase [Rhodococcus jostii]|uniref:Vanillate O-demethylase ferredoxin subunit n=1 Tax=Rhodococcus jostii TaxID=132919 RepID=A0A1H5FEP2_RHOJO|nr:PDR/VanB family oxidoreductase [Rhodococcus jostii]SEE01846.1 vanillate O-demethylase ferredoxin subunit [Rhodococcus jostii]
MSLFTVTVAEIVEETPDIKSFRLVRTDGSPFDPYPAGAHIDILGPTEVLTQYSLCSPPHESDSYVVAIKRENGPRGGSAALHDRVTLGSELQISRPRTLLAVAEEADRHILVAAGIGLTPMLSLAFALHRQGQPFDLHYFARARGQAAFVELLEASEFHRDVHLHFGLTRDDQLSALEKILADASAATHVYTCGPEGFMTRVRELAEPAVGEDSVHFEHFEAAAPVSTGEDTAFELELDTGEVFEVPAGKSIAEVLEENDIEIDTSCREGICGTCILDVLGGEPDHRDNCLTKSERKAGDRIAACVSRARSGRLVVELP